MGSYFDQYDEAGHIVILKLIFEFIKKNCTIREKSIFKTSSNYCSSIPIGLTRVLSNSTASAASSFSFWFGLYGGRLIRSNMFKVEVSEGGELVVVFAARGDPETNEGHLEKRL